MCPAHVEVKYLLKLLLTFQGCDIANMPVILEIDVYLIEIKVHSPQA